MPYIDGKFVPRPFQPLTLPLFALIPPDDPARGGPPTEEDWEWWRGLRLATAELLMFVVDQVRRHYEGHKGVAFGPDVVTLMMRQAQDIADEFLDGADCRRTRRRRRVSASYVSKGVNKTAKQVGLVVYSTEPGIRHNWPTVPKDLDLDLDKALEIIEQAMRGNWNAFHEGDVST